MCNRFCFCIELCYSSVHAEFTIDLYSSYETHKSKCLILCRDLRRSITVKFLKICIGSYETKTFSQIEHCVFNCFAVVCNDVYSVYILKASSCSLV